MAVAALFLPRTGLPWLIFVMGILIPLTFSVLHRFAWILGIFVVILIVGAIWLSVAMPRRLLIATAIFGPFSVFMFFSSFLVASGQGYHLVNNKAASVPFGLARAVLLLATLWLLLGVPDQAHKIGLSKDGYAQRVLVGVITAAACVLTSTYFFSLRFHSGPLHDVHAGPLVTGIVFTAVLVAPIYAHWRARAGSGASRAFSAGSVWRQAGARW
jgi:hypothetical protein